MRGQAYTLEGVVAALLVASSVLVGLQAVSTTPWVVGTDDPVLEQRRTQAHDLLVAAEENGSLSPALRCVDGRGRLNPDVVSVTPFGRLIEQSLDERGFGYRLSIAYWNESKASRTRIIIDQTGAPRGDAVSATRTITLTDGMGTYDSTSVPPCAPTTTTLATDSGFYIPDVNDSAAVYNVVDVRLDIWGGRG